MTKDKTRYSDDSIQSLDPRSHVRLRPGMYVGSTANPNHLLMEIFANALDEHNIGHGNRITVNINDNGTVQVEDNGQGFPINVIRNEDKKTVLEASFSVTNTSGKFTDDGVYGGSSLGLNGLGGKLCNFLSEWFEVISHNRNGQYEHLWFKDGVFQKREVGSGFTWSGTTVTYKPDKQFFDTDKTDVKFFEEFFNDICCLCPNLTVVLNNTQINHPKGIEEILPRKLGNNIEIINNPMTLFAERGKNKLDFALTFTGSSSSTIIPYVNYGVTDSGPHVTAIKSTITRIFNSWAKENGLLGAKDKNLDGNSIQEGMLLVCNIVTTNVAYDAQVKSRVSKMDTGWLTELLAKELELWLDNNPEDAKIIIDKALLARKAAEAAKKARAAVKNKAEKKDKKTFLNMPTTLVDCFTKNREEAELYVVEGLSAASSLVAQRNGATQAVYSVRGMMLNIQKVANEKIVQNKEINNLITALGLDYDPRNGQMKYDKKKLRYGKIIAASDADPAGSAIENLLFNILWGLCPDLIIEGHVYSAEPPLFRATTKKNEYFFLKGQQELDDFKKHHTNFEIQRCKGLGEMLPEQLAECILDKETRAITQLKVEDIGKIDTLFNTLYGREVPPRVKFIEENSWKADMSYE